MRILLIGDYSGLFNNLKKGLIKLGHSVTLLSNGDGWKKIPGADGELFKSGSGFKGRLSRIFEPLRDERLYKGYDAVVLIGLDVFYPVVIGKVLKKLKKHNGKVFLCSCGGSYSLYKAYKNNKFDYYMYDDMNSKNGNRYFVSKIWRMYGCLFENRHIRKYIKTVIPSLYEYEFPYVSENIRLSNTIPFPINVDELRYNENVVSNKKLVIFHGINNEVAKGTNYIRKALQQIQRDYEDQVEIIIDGRMPYDRYIDVIKRANVIIDQCKTYGYGMNACISMAQGKVVLSGVREETLKSFGINREDCPMISICPNEEIIYKQLEMLIINMDNISYMGENSRRYVEKYHNYITVAKQYENILME